MPALSPADNERAQFAKRFWRLFIKTGLTQSEFARRADISRDRITKFVKGQQLPSTAVLVKLVRGLNACGSPCGVQDLMPGFSHEDMRMVAAHDALAARTPGTDGDAMPLATRTFDFLGDQVHVRFNEMLPRAVAMKVILLLEEADAARAATGSRPADDHE